MNQYLNKSLFQIKNNVGITTTMKRYIFDTLRGNTNIKPVTIRQTRDSLQKRVSFSAVFTNEAIDRSELLSYKIVNQNDLPASRMRDSYSEAIIPIGSDLAIRERYVTFHHKVRFGRLLEDLDTMSVHASYLHNQSQVVNVNGKSMTPIVIVTALVDRIEVKTTDIRIDKDLRIRGFTSWVGKTSSETTMKLEQEIAPNQWEHILDAKFLVCARDAANKGSAIMNPLLLETDEERLMYELGEKNKLIRQKESLRSLFNVPPSNEDSLLIHEIFKETIDLQSGSLQNRILPLNSVWMGDTTLKNIHICQPEQRNIYNKVFGGFVMRKAFELAWANAAIFSKGSPEIVVVDDVSFKRPVLIGSLFLLSSQVVHTQNDYVQVKVHGEILDRNTNKHHTTNEFYFKFLIRDKTNVPRVIPKTYSEAMIYIDGRRHW